MIFGESDPIALADEVLTDHILTLRDIGQRLLAIEPELDLTRIVIPGGGACITDGILGRDILIIDEKPFYIYHSNQEVKGWKDAIAIAESISYKHQEFRYAGNVYPAIQILQQLKAFGVNINNVFYQQKGNLSQLLINDGKQEKLRISYCNLKINDGAQLNSIASEFFGGQKFGMVAKAFLGGSRITRESLEYWGGNNPHFFILDKLEHATGENDMYLDTHYNRSVYTNNLASWGYQINARNDKGNVIHIGVRRSI